MPELVTRPNLQAVDDLYERLVRLHEGRSEAESLRIWPKLVLLLANHIGDREAIDQAISLASKAPGET